MIPWKLIIGVFVVLIIISGLIANSGGLFDKFRGFLKDSPLSGFVDKPEKGSENVNIRVYSDLDLDISSPVNISSQDVELNEFTGTFNINLQDKDIKLEQADSRLRMKIGLGEVKVDGLDFGKLSLKSSSFSISKNGWKKDSNNGSLEITDFSGFAIIRNDLIEFNGNVSGLREI